MTLLLTHADVQASVSMADAIVAMEEAFAEEGEGAALLHGLRDQFNRGIFQLFVIKS